MPTPSYQSGRIHGVAGCTVLAPPGKPTVEERIARYEAMGMLERQPRQARRYEEKPPLSDAQKAEAKRLREVEELTFEELGFLYCRSASTMRTIVGADPRFDRRRRREGTAA